MAVATTHEAFSQNLNTKFQLLTPDAGCIELELISVSELLTSPRQERFSIFFRGPQGISLPQAIYEFQHERMGSFELFIVPVNQDGAGIYYEAVFNRIPQAS